jgi:hypothetical protein
MPSALDALRSIPVEQVENDLKRVRAERARLAKEEDLLEQVLALHRAEGTPEQQEYVARVIRGDPNQPITGARTARGRRGQILQLMAEAMPDKDEWTPAEIIAALRERGSRARDEAIRVNLRRMLDADPPQLERPRHGVYKLPSNESSSQQALDGGSEE